jgi:hypothetical protein
MRNYLKEVTEVAVKKEGNCVTTTTDIITYATKLDLICKNGHTWKAKPWTILNGHWCKKCSRKRNGEKRRSGLQICHKLAEARNAICLSTEYKNTDTKYLWKCAQGHIFPMSAKCVKIGQWCPNCAPLKGERLVKIFFETVFNKKFQKQKFDWLLNSRGNKMEIDGHCEELKIGFEHQGKAHFGFIKFFHGEEENFKQRQIDDKEKYLTYTQKGYRLFVIPEVPALLSLQKLKDFVKSQAENLNVELPENFKNIEPDYSKAYKNFIYPPAKDHPPKKGAYWNGKNYWFARITIDKKNIFLGSYRTQEEAHQVFLLAYKTHYGRDYKPNTKIGIVKFRGTWACRIRINGKVKHIGYYTTQEEAQQKYFETYKEVFGKEYIPV